MADAKQPFPSDRALAELGLFFALLSIAGVGVPMIWPDQRGVGILFFVVGVSGCVAIAALSVVRLIQSKRARLGTVLATLGTLLVISGAVIGLIGAFMTDKKSATEASSPLDGVVQITIEPGTFPTVMPSNKMFELQLQKDFSTVGGAFLGPITAPVGTPLSPRDPAIFAQNVLRMRISNYGKAAILNMTVTVPIKFEAVIKRENSIGSGEILKTTALTTIPFSMAAGDVVDIFIYNQTQSAFAEIDVPQTARGTPIGSDKEETFRLIPPFFGGMGLPPFTPKSPPEPPHQAQAPQGKPKTK